MSSLPNPRNSQAQPHWLQNRSVPKPLHLEAQPGPTPTSNQPGSEAIVHQCPPSPNSQTFNHHPLPESRTTPREASHENGRDLLGRHTGLEDASGFLEQQLRFPPEILTIKLRPDLILWSTVHKSLFIIELTVPSEAEVGEANEWKRLKYVKTATEAQQRG